MVKLLNVVGARPNFMKMAPIVAEVARRAGEVTQTLVHTGQHYDEAMSTSFFRDLGMGAPDINLEVGSGTHAEQTARVMLAFEPVLLRERPDWLVVVGDVNSTIACALVASKLGVRVAHVEAGLRSNDWRMPEEVNRVLTDRMSDLLLTPSADADENLVREGLPADRIVRVGNVMIDTLLRQRESASHSRILADLELSARDYAVLTLHRPANVDDRDTLAGLLGALGEIARRVEVIFPAHPRTQARIREMGLAVPPGVRVLGPLGYADFLHLWSNALLVLTDSGGLQEETTALGIPCLTLRENTERPVTVTEGSNQVVGCHPARILAAATDIMNARAGATSATDAPPARIPALWDGQTARRIVAALLERS
ncbi:MAG: non-hydrolyzing UDP-N-acetylglucosamine 2-epimerase [Blastocatellia bacterium]